MAKVKYRIVLQKKPVNNDNALQLKEREARVARTPVKKQSRRKYLFLLILLSVVIVSGLYGISQFKSKVVAINPDPFNQRTRSSVQFPLYYPKKPPLGFHVDNKSVTEPQKGVVVFTLDGPGKQRLYVSEESRDLYFNLIAYYKKFKDLEVTTKGNNLIAVGRVNGGFTEIGSDANNSTWVLSNTNSHVPLSQLTDMLKSLVKSP